MFADKDLSIVPFLYCIKMEKTENIESQKEFLLKMLELIPELESNGLTISSVVSAYSDMETYDILSKNVVRAMQSMNNFYKC